MLLCTRCHCDCHAQRGALHPAVELGRALALAVGASRGIRLGALRRGDVAGTLRSRHFPGRNGAMMTGEKDSLFESILVRTL